VALPAVASAAKEVRLAMVSAAISGMAHMS
jgi:hypothetical protein